MTHCPIKRSLRPTCPGVRAERETCAADGVPSAWWKGGGFSVRSALSMATRVVESSPVEVEDVEVATSKAAGTVCGTKQSAFDSATAVIVVAIFEICRDLLVDVSTGQGGRAHPCDRRASDFLLERRI